MKKYLETIEGEFVSHETWAGMFSGYHCLRCKHVLLTGTEACPECGTKYDLPTILVSDVLRLAPEIQPRFSLGRTTAEEIAKLQKLRKKR